MGEWISELIFATSTENSSVATNVTQGPHEYLHPSIEITAATHFLQIMALKLTLCFHGHVLFRVDKSLVVNSWKNYKHCNNSCKSESW